MFITTAWLEVNEACEEYLDKFQERFPTGIELTRQALTEHGADFEIGWLAKRVLSSNQWEYYREASSTIWDSDLSFSASRSACAYLLADILFPNGS